MQNFFIRLGDEFLVFLKKYRLLIVFSFLCLLAGIVLGIFSVDNNSSFLKVLNSSNKILLELIRGDAEPFALFFSKLLESVLLFLLIFVFSLSIYSCFLCFLFIIYQGLTLAIISATIIRAYSFSGILNVIFVICPINILWFCVIVLAITLCVARAYEAKKYNLSFNVSFKYFEFFKKYVICFCFALIVVIVYSFIVPLLLKSFVYIVY
ncbi:MAG: hypothetical protein K6F08_00015 [bacterium]|nr:hypothetical protein [bacterium]